MGKNKNFILGSQTEQNHRNFMSAASVDGMINFWVNISPKHQFVCNNYHSNGFLYNFLCEPDNRFVTFC